MEWRTTVTSQTPAPGIELIESFENVDWTTESPSDRDAAWLSMLVTHPSTQLVRNVSTVWRLMRVHETWLPITVNSTEYDNAYVCSPYTGAVLYPQSEVAKLGGFWLPNGLRLLMKSLAAPLRWSQINRAVCVNNWLLSTNLYAPLRHDAVPAITSRLVERYPSHAVLWRSLNRVTNAALLDQLVNSGYELAPSRQVYFFDGQRRDYLDRSNTRVDLKLLRNTDYQIVPHEQLQPSDATRLQQLYHLLYVDKYSPHNPQFTATMIDLCRQHRLLKMWGLRHPSGRLDGVLGVFERDGVITAPLVGYDTVIPSRVGLYRMLMAIVLEYAAEAGCLLNLSSGAAEFKRLRGGEAAMEYTAIYAGHLPPARRLAWFGLAWMLRHIGAPLLRKYRL